MSYTKKSKENFWIYEKHPCFSFDGLWTTSGLLKLFSLIAN